MTGNGNVVQHELGAIYIHCFSPIVNRSFTQFFSCELKQYIYIYIYIALVMTKGKYVEPAILHENETAIIWSARDFFRGPDSRSVLDSQRRRMRKQDKSLVLPSQKACRELRLRRWTRVHNTLFQDLLQRLEVAEKESDGNVMKEE